METKNYYICPDCGAKTFDKICPECDSKIIFECDICCCELEDNEENICVTCEEIEMQDLGYIQETQNNLDLHHR